MYEFCWRCFHKDLPGQLVTRMSVTNIFVVFDVFLLLILFCWGRWFETCVCVCLQCLQCHIFLEHHR